MSVFRWRNTPESEFKRFDSGYERVLFGGIIFILGIAATLVFQNFFLGADLRIKPINSSGSEITQLDIVFDDLSVSIPGDQIGGTESRRVFVIHLDEPSTYAAQATMADGRVITSEPLSIKPGCFVIVVVQDERVVNDIRTCR